MKFFKCAIFYLVFRRSITKNIMKEGVVKGIEYQAISLVEWQPNRNTYKKKIYSKMCRRIKLVVGKTENT